MSARPEAIQWERQDPTAQPVVAADPTGGGIKLIAHWRGHDLTKDLRYEAGASSWRISVHRNGYFVAVLDAPAYEPVTLHLTEDDPFWHQPWRLLPYRTTPEIVADAITHATDCPDPLLPWPYAEGVCRLDRKRTDSGGYAYPRGYCMGRWRDLRVDTDFSHTVSYGRDE